VARAILRNPAILILDEPTSHIDPQSEGEIGRSLRDAAQGRTVFSISHRPSALIPADVVVVMERARIASVGSYEQLVEAYPAYASSPETPRMNRDDRFVSPAALHRRAANEDLL
jgi:ATP-binding cassette subfamily B protein